MSPVEVFATATKFFDQQKVYLIVSSFPSRLLVTCSRVKGQNAAAHS